MSPLVPAAFALAVSAALLAERALGLAFQTGMAATFSDAAEKAGTSPEKAKWARAAFIRCTQSWGFGTLAITAALAAGFCWGRL